ncbi:hypothetical protein KM043_000543 [Ampulex compressa]|nr:hypothetical protein KM043_000543 [Ampulex compressa]
MHLWSIAPRIFSDQPDRIAPRSRESPTQIPPFERTNSVGPSRSKASPPDENVGLLDGRMDGWREAEGVSFAARKDAGGPTGDTLSGHSGRAELPLGGPKEAWKRSEDVRIERCQGLRPITRPND